MEKTLIFIGIHLSLPSAYQKATTIFVVAHFNLPLILHALGEKLFCYIVWLNLALFTDLWYNDEKKGGIDINENN